MVCTCSKTPTASSIVPNPKPIDAPASTLSIDKFLFPSPINPSHPKVLPIDFVLMLDIALGTMYSKCKVLFCKVECGCLPTITSLFVLIRGFWANPPARLPP